jgi:hypothetical protein
MSPPLGRVIVRLADANGHRGGEDEFDRDVYAAIDRAAGRAGRAAARTVGRQRGREVA